MKQENIKLEHIPAIIYGQKSDKVYFFVHGKCGNKEEAERFAEIAVPHGFQVIAVDLPCHGERQNEKDGFYPWVAVPELKCVMEYILSRWQKVSLRANSIGAMFSLLAFYNCKIDNCLLVSPVVDMEKLIKNMMQWAGVTENELERRQEIETSFGETLSWKYYSYIKSNPIKKPCFPVHILYAALDNLTDRDTIDDFCKKNCCTLKVMDDGEHWFHTAPQLEFMAAWEDENIV